MINKSLEQIDINTITNNEYPNYWNYTYAEKRICPITREVYTDEDDDLIFEIGISLDGLKELYNYDLGREFISQDTEENIPDEDVYSYCFSDKNIDYFAEFVIDEYDIKITDDLIVDEAYEERSEYEW